MTEHRVIIVDLSSLYTETAKLEEMGDYEKKVRHRVGEGNDVVLTGPAPVWLYLRIAHALHGCARRLHYRAPVLAEDLVIFDHNPY